MCLDKGNPIHRGLLWRNTPIFSFLFGPEHPELFGVQPIYTGAIKEFLFWVIIWKIQPQSLSWPPGSQHLHGSRSVENLPCMLCA